MRQAYLKLGQNEPVDQTDFAKFLAAKPYIDESLVAIWGWVSSKEGIIYFVELPLLESG